MYKPNSAQPTGRTFRSLTRVSRLRSLLAAVVSLAIPVALVAVDGPRSTKVGAAANAKKAGPTKEAAVVESTTSLGPSLVSVSGRQLIVRKRNQDGTLGAPAPYTIRGVDWSPASRGTNTSKEDPNNANVRRPEFGNWSPIDIPLMREMNVNTVYTYMDLGLDANGTAVLDQLYANNIMVVMTVDEGVNNLGRVQQAVNFYKDHPAVLAWMLGNEWNINRYFTNPQISAAEAAQRTETAAALIKTLDANHPVATSYGDIDIASFGMQLADTQNYVNNVCQSVDMWALNIFRDNTFGALFDQWKVLTSKPMLLGEFGTDAFRSVTAGSVSGSVDGVGQAQWDVNEWNHLVKNLSAQDPAKVAVGGFVFEWCDEWWKVQPSGSQENSGFTLTGGHPDDFASEEYFGIVDIDRNPRPLYYALKVAFAATYQPPQTVTLRAASRGLPAAEYNFQNGVALFFKDGKILYRANGGGGGGRGFNIAAFDPCTNALLMPIQHFDTFETRATGSGLNDIINLLDSLPNGTFILIAVADEAGLNQFPPNDCQHLINPFIEPFFQKLEALGSQQIRNYCYWNSWAMATVKGEGHSRAEQLINAAEASASGTQPLSALLTPTAKSFAANGGSDSVNVSTAGGCGWTSVSNDSFVSVTPPGSGTGNGTVNYSVAANGNTISRVGTMTIAGQTFVVSQSAPTPTPTPTPRTLTVASANPASGVSITVTPNDNNNQGNGTTQFTRIYNNNTGVTLTAPPTAGGNNFQKWQRDGSDWSTSTNTNVNMDANHTMTAVYTTPVVTRTLTVASSNPSSGVSITVSPNDNNGQGSGTTQFTRTYNNNTNVNLTAPATASGNNFQKWQRDGSDWNTSTNTNVTMGANHTMTAVYASTPPPTRTLTVASSNPSSGVSITVSPNDNNGQSSGTTQFSRVYSNNTNMSLTATATAGGNNFQKWQLDGVDLTTSLLANFVMDANHTVTAVYVSGSGGNAVYDAVLKAPKCSQPGSICDSGALLDGRDTFSGGPEPNQPNTINSSCADGTNGTYHSDESSDRIKVSTLDGSTLAPGKTVKIDTTVWVWTDPTQDHLDLYYAADAGNPTWIYMATWQPTVAGSQVFSTTFTLSSGGSLQAVRANFRFQGAASSCGTNSSFDDYDDLIFAVGPGGTPSTNFARSTNGGVASASSTTPNGQFPGFNFLPSVTTDGDRKSGVNFWRDDTANAYPDWVQVDFNGSKSITEIDVFTLQDNDQNPSDPTQAMTFSINGITAFDVQYWTGSAWVAVPNGSVTGNNKVWRQFTFSPITTSKVRVLVNNALNGRSRVVELEAWGTAVTSSTTNQALAANGGVATASSTTPNSQAPGYNFLPAVTIDGDRKSGVNFWRDDTANAYPDWLQVDFSGSKNITEIDVFTLQDNDQNPVDPTQSMTFSVNGITAFDVQYWTGSAWVTVPNGSVTGNNKVWRQFTFSPIMTTKVRVLVNNALNTRSRVVELEAWSSTNQAASASGGVATASTTTPNSQFPGYNFLPSVTIDGDRKSGVNFWRDDTANAYPDWLQVDFSGSKTITEIDVFTLQDNDQNPVDPTLATTFSINGITAFDVQYWTGSAWVTVPNGSVTGNNKVWRQFTFSPIMTSKIRVLVNNALNSRSRIVELEAY